MREPRTKGGSQPGTKQALFAFLDVARIIINTRDSKHSYTRISSDSRGETVRLRFERRRLGYSRAIMHGKCCRMHAQQQMQAMCGPAACTSTRRRATVQLPTRTAPSPLRAMGSNNGVGPRLVPKRDMSSEKTAGRGLWRFTYCLSLLPGPAVHWSAGQRACAVLICASMVL